LLYRLLALLGLLNSTLGGSDFRPKTCFWC
jgi:hypothetical protein